MLDNKTSVQYSCIPDFDYFELERHAECLVEQMCLGRVRQLSHQLASLGEQVLSTQLKIWINVKKDFFFTAIQYNAT